MTWEVPLHRVVGDCYREKIFLKRLSLRPYKVVLSTKENNTAPVTNYVTLPKEVSHRIRGGSREVQVYPLVLQDDYTRRLPETTSHPCTVGSDTLTSSTCKQTPSPPSSGKDSYFY